MDIRKHDILEALRAHVNGRPGLEFANYGDIRAYRAESRQILRDKRDFEQLFNAVSWRDSLTADDLQAATRAYSGRLQIKEGPERRVTVEYCTGQYYPTEYRKAACAVLAAALWDYWRDGCKTGDDIRKKAAKELGGRIASRWFN